MANWVDYREVKANININQVLGYYNIQLQAKGETQLTGKCPLPDHAGDRSNKNAFHVDTAKNVFNCFSHCGGGNIIDLVSKMENCDIRQAAFKLQEWFLLDTSPPENLENTQIEKGSENPIKNKPLTFELKGLQAKHPFLIKRKGLKPNTIKEFGLGFCTKGLLAGWIAIPVHNIEGEIVAYIGRAINNTQAELDGKYKIPPGFKKTLEIYNLHRVLKEPEAIEKHGLILVESFFGVQHLWQNDYKNVVGLLGKEISEYQLTELLKAANKFTLFLDGDEPGRLATKKVAAKFIHSGFIRIIKYPEGAKRKPTHFSGKELKQII